MLFSKPTLTVLAFLATISSVVVDAQLEGFTAPNCTYLDAEGTSEEINAKTNACVAYQSTDGATCDAVESPPRWQVLPEGGITSGQVQSNECLAYWLCDRDSSECEACGDCGAAQGATVAPEPIITTLGSTQEGNTTEPPTDSGTDSGASTLSSSLLVVLVGAGIAAIAM